MNLLATQLLATWYTFLAPPISFWGAEIRVSQPGKQLGQASLGAAKGFPRFPRHVSVDTVEISGFSHHRFRCRRRVSFNFTCAFFWHVEISAIEYNVFVIKFTQSICELGGFHDLIWVRGSKGPSTPCSSIVTGVAIFAENNMISFIFFHLFCGHFRFRAVDNVTLKIDNAERQKGQPGSFERGSSSYASLRFILDMVVHFFD